MTCFNDSWLISIQVLRPVTVLFHENGINGTFAAISTLAD